MNNFTFHNPTRLLFGKGMIEKLSTAIPMVHRIMITFGGGSVKAKRCVRPSDQGAKGS